ncbi:hypothetical protein GCK72_006635 [Caenorhabditis remanei]|uniref:Uncharacterized protein n=1 Tax=Caenorhabditis remanei TaxID=31234 RepID=A0A6A5HJ96_CAERE|nr:hypothetical protein GCK72_006635 [Caenorhabditis remanei]KAF1766677.1 hypothetical protein GCK72_006635 [Caenorhabditis remanei]
MLPSRRSESHSPASRCKSAGHPLTTNGFHSIPSSASSSTHSMNRQGSVDNLIFKLLTRQKYVAKCLGFVPARSSVAIQTTPIVERDLVGCFQTEASSFEASKPRISNITFSTVTSATGLPTVPAEPNKARSSRKKICAVT